VKAWAAKHKYAGLVVIGVHTPEFSFEHEPANVENAVHDPKVTYPIAIDSNTKIWNSFDMACEYAEWAHRIFQSQKTAQKDIRETE
jgi:hypothetical protein